MKPSSRCSCTLAECTAWARMSVCATERIAGPRELRSCTHLQLPFEISLH